MSPPWAIRLVWLCWIASWLAAGVWSDPPVARAGVRRELGYAALTVAGVVLLFGLYRTGGAPGLERRWWRLEGALAWGAVALAVLGFGFTWWARLHLGRLWSRSVVRKAQHRVVESGPYALVRHPIYAGIMLATLATVVLFATTAAMVGGALLVLAWVVKARLEERFLREQLGRETYEAYAARVPMFVPAVGIRRRGRTS